MASGTKPRKNKEAMEAVLTELREEGLFFGDNPKKTADGAGDNAADEAETDEEVGVKKNSKKDKKAKKEKKEKKEKKDKSSKKRKRSEVADDSDEDAELVEAAKTKKKKRTK